MSNWAYDEPLDEDSARNRHTVCSEDQIIKSYYGYWRSKMKSLNREHLISRKHCIEDWVTVHWAYRTFEEANI